MKLKRAHKIIVTILVFFFIMIYLIRHRVEYDFNSRLSDIKCDVHTKEALLLKEDIITAYEKWVYLIYYDVPDNRASMNNDDYIKYCKSKGLFLPSKTCKEIIKEYKISNKKEKVTIEKYLNSCINLIFDINGKYLPDVNEEYENKNFISKYLFL